MATKTDATGKTFERCTAGNCLREGLTYVLHDLTSSKPSLQSHRNLPCSLTQTWSHMAVPSAHSSTSSHVCPSPRKPTTSKVTSFYLAAHHML